MFFFQSELSSLQKLQNGQNGDQFPSDDPFFTPPIGHDGDTVSLAFIISLSVTFAILMILLVSMAAYVMFCGADESEYDEEAGMNSMSNIGIHTFFGKKTGSISLDADFENPGEFDDELELNEQEAIELPKMSAYEVELYNRAKEYQKLNPPLIKDFNTYLNAADKQFIKDRGIQSYFFFPSINDNVDDAGNFLPSLLVQDKLDVVFTKYNKSSSTLLNYPLPFNKKDAVYFEVKVFRLPPESNSIFSVGLVTCPYPYFRIPGVARYSIAYESTGKLKINNPFRADTLLPKLQEGDVVGFGLRHKTHSVFITHNGKKMMDIPHKVGIDLFVSVGSFNASYTRTYTKDGLLEDPDNLEIREMLSQGENIKLPAKVEKVHSPYDKNQMVDSDEIELHLNIGQVGYVFIEANVKKYSFGSLMGEIGIPPSYNGDEIKHNAIIQRGEEMPPTYANNSEDSFFGNIRMSKETKPKNSALPSIARKSSGKASSNSVSSFQESYERTSSQFDQENNSYSNHQPVTTNHVTNNLSTQEGSKVGSSNSESIKVKPSSATKLNNKKNNKKKGKRKKHHKR